MLSSSRLSREAVRTGFVLFLALFSPVSGQTDDSAPLASRVQASAAPAQADLIPGCDDRNPCTIDSLDTSTGTCRHDPRSCDDGNACTRDSCQEGFGGGCRHEAVADATPCDDAEGCTQGDACSAGVCVPGAILDANAPCDDGNPCTVDDACDASRHCRGTPLGDGAACDDHDACTRDERCVTGADDTVACEGTGPDCSDGDLCTEDRCDPATGQCLHPPVSCVDGNACTTDVCDPATGLCRRDNIGGPCEDGRYCTVNDVCTGGNCVGQQRECLQPSCGVAVCDQEDDFCRIRDGSGCPPSGQCFSWSCQNGTCQLFQDSGSPCTITGLCGFAHCIRGQCVPELILPCDDSNGCTEDVCPFGSCTHPPKPNGTPCGDACSVNATCQNGRCIATATNCDDGNACTDDSCDPEIGCQHRQRNCDDGNVCTRDSCSIASGCAHQPESGAPCKSDVSDPCHRGFCQDGACTGLAPISCDDGMACTQDSCDPAMGACVNRVTCDDGNTCTADICSASGGCLYIGQPVGFPCTDFDPCTAHDLCSGPVSARVCVGTAVSCDDGNACTADHCDQVEGCLHDPASQPVTCGVGACQRTVDVCAGAGACVPGAPAPETCNGVDDDCDGQVDERTLLPVCTVRPTTMKEGTGGKSFAVTCLLSRSCRPTLALPNVSTAWISAVDLSLDPSDDVTFPDPGAAACGALPGLPGEKGIVEDVAHRTLSDASVTFVFDRPSDGVCATPDGGRPDLTALMGPMPDRAVVRVCVSTSIDGQAAVQSCGKVRKGNGGASAPHRPRPE